MSGRPKQKRYQYNSEGKFLKEFDCEDDIRKTYYSKDKGKRPLFRNNCLEREYHLLPNNDLIFKERTGRKLVQHINNYINNEYVNAEKYKTPAVRLVNLDNKTIARFINTNIASKLTGISESTILHNLEAKGNKLTKRGLIFKYAE